MAEITAEMNLKITGVQAGLEKVRAEIAGLKKFASYHGTGVGSEFGSAFNKGLRNMVGGALTTGAITAAVKGLVEDYSALADMSARFEASPESMQKLEYHAKLAGTTLESAASAISRLQVSLERTSDPKVIAALKELRITAVTLAGESPHRQFELLSEAFNRANADGRGLSATRDLLGKGFAELLPMLREWNEVSKDSIPIISDDDVATLKRFGDGWEKLKMSMKVAVAGQLMNPQVSNAGAAGTGQAGTNWAAGAWMGQGGMAITPEARKAIQSTDESQGSWMSSMLEMLSRREALARAFNTKLEAYNRIKEQTEAEARKSEAKEAEAEVKARKQRESSTHEEQGIRIQELRAAGRMKEAEKLERLKKGQQEFERLRDAHPEKGEAWALQMAHRKDDAEHMKPGMIRGVKYTPPAPGAGLDWLYGHNRDRGGQPMNKEFKFNQLDELVRLQKRTVDLLE